ncbi:hypothetical protein FB381_2408 [Nocardioides albertanoniae]|uniref:Uncharacterized protein n=1 Tax=Nocardioides albertanoniae TaxID=1175486 RepID=A0A543A7F1_9ACTN|nr:hypothetical protein [Nocardioides albertanoniae]TQL68518.1 hypothetical protein FB381_2408 [Nocardioides albertanoniae]
MATSTPLLPSPAAVSAAILELAGSERPGGVDDGLRLMTSLGIAHETSGGAADQGPTVIADVTGDWGATRSGLVLAPDGTVEHFWSHLWVAAASGASGFDSLVDAISSSIGTADEDVETDGSRSAWWNRHPAEIELYLYPERAPAPAAAQIGITWADGASAARAF